MSGAYEFAKRHEITARLRKLADGLIDNAFASNDVIKPAIYKLADELANLSAPRTPTEAQTVTKDIQDLWDAEEQFTALAGHNPKSRTPTDAPLNCTDERLTLNAYGRRCYEAGQQSRMPTDPTPALELAKLPRYRLTLTDCSDADVGSWEVGVELDPEGSLVKFEDLLALPISSGRTPEPEPAPSSCPPGKGVQP